MLVDHEKAWQRFKAVVASKSSHGQKDLLAEMSRIEVECGVEEGLPEKALRLYGIVISDDLLKPSQSDPRVGQGDGTDQSPSRSGGDPHGGSENGSRNTAQASA